MPSPSLETAAHIVQLALTPIFLLSGVASLLNVFATRLGRVADQVDRLIDDPGFMPDGRNERLRILQIRSKALDLAVVLAALAGAATCGAAMVMFLGAMRDSGAAGLLFLLFGLAIVLTMGALAAYVFEMLLAGRSVRREASRQQDG